MSIGSTVLPAGIRGRILAGLAALVCAGSSELAAQVVQLRPLANISLPTRISMQDRVLHVRQRIGMSVGARLILTFNPRFDVVTGVSYVPGVITIHGAGKRVAFSTSSHVLSGSTGARYWLLPPPRTLSWELHTGVGMVFGGSPSYDELFEASTLTGVVGTTLRYQVGRIVNLRMRVQERLYRIQFGDRNPTGSRPLQVSFGLGLTFLESAR